MCRPVMMPIVYAIIYWDNPYTSIQGSVVSMDVGTDGKYRYEEQ